MGDGEGPDVEIRVLGPLEVEVDGARVALPSKVERSVLVALALRGGESVTAATLAADVWGDDPPASWRKGVHVRVSRLRRRLEGPTIAGTDVVATTDDGYRLAVPGDRVDAVRFERLLGEGRRLLAEGRAVDAERALGTATALWRGEPLAEIADTPAGQAERSRLSELREVAVDEWHAARLGVGEHHTLVAALEAGVADQPLRERRWEQLMLALYRSGRQSEALRAYQRARELLNVELGIEPGPDLRRIDAAVLANDPSLDLAPDPARRAVAVPGLTAAAPVERPLDWVRRQQAVPLVGRGDERDHLEAVWRRVCDEPAGGLVVLTGDALVGKTRLVAELADLAAGEGALVLAGRCVAGGGWSALVAAFAPLGVPVPDSAHTPGSAPAVTHALAVVDRLFEVARTRPVLVFIDDFQVADADLIALARVMQDRPTPLDEPIPVLVVLAVRDGVPVPPDMAGMTRDAARLRVSEHLAVPHLSLDEGRALLSERLASEGATGPQAAIAELAQDLGGNAGAIVEMGRHLSGRRVEPGGLEVLGVPDTLQAQVNDRLVALPAEVVRFLLAASVLGPTFDVEALAAATGSDPDATLDALDAAIAARFLVADPTGIGAFQFVTAVERIVTSERLSPQRRAHIQDRLAGAGRDRG